RHPNPNRTRGERSENRSDHLAETTRQRPKRPVRGARAHSSVTRGCSREMSRRVSGGAAQLLLPECAQQTAVLSLCRRKPRKQRLDRETVDVAGVNAREQRLGKKRHGFVAEPPPHEGCDRLVTCIETRWNEQFGGHAQLPAPREQACRDEGTH